jgi:hypothetical protein
MSACACVFLTLVPVSIRRKVKYKAKQLMELMQASSGFVCLAACMPLFTRQLW